MLRRFGVDALGFREPFKGIMGDNKGYVGAMILRHMGFRELVANLLTIRPRTEDLLT